MRQIWISEAGLPEVLQESSAADPAPRSGEVRIRVEASGVNFADALGRMGIYRDAPPLPYVPGYEVSGKVDLVGQGVTGFDEGDNVFAITRFGGYSDVVCVPYRQVFRRLEWMGGVDAAAIPVNYLTAYLMLIVMGSLRPGNSVLIHNAGGGVGLAALDICRIVGAETFGTASAHKHSFLRERGLDHEIDYTSRDYERAIREMTDGKGVQIILEPQGGVHWAKNYRLLRPSGRLIHFGISSAAPAKRRSWLGMLRLLSNWEFYSPAKLMNDNKAVMGVNLAHLWEETQLLQSSMAHIMNWYDEALFRPHIDKRFKFSEAAEAHHYIQDRKNIGKVLLIP